MKITLKHLIILLVLSCLAYFIYVNWYQDKTAVFESEHPLVKKINTELRVIGDFLIGKSIDLYDYSKDTYDNNIKDSVDNTISTTQDKINTVKETLSGAEDTYNKAKEVIDKGKETIDSAQNTINTITKDSVDIDKLGGSITGSINTSIVQ